MAKKDVTINRNDCKVPNPNASLTHFPYQDAKRLVLTLTTTRGHQSLNLKKNTKPADIFTWIPLNV